MKKIFLSFLLLSLLFATGCGEEEYGKSIKRLQFSFENLPVLESGHYEAWIFNNTSSVMIKQFKVDKDQNMLNLAGNKIEDNIVYFGNSLGSYQQIKIIIAPVGKKDLREAAVILESQLTPLSTQASLAFEQVNLSNISAKYHLGTISSATDKLTTNGLWFAEIKNGIQSPGLKIPPTSAGWIYEGWIKRDDKYLSLGKFGGPFEADLSNIYSNVLSFIKYAGEDFLHDPPLGYQFPLNLADGETKVSITLQPYLVDDTVYRCKKPFFTIFAADIPKNLFPNTVQEMKIITDEIPSGKVVSLNE